MKTLILLLLIVGCSTKLKKAAPLPESRTIVLIQGVQLDDTSWNTVKGLLPAPGLMVMSLNRVGRDEKHPASLTEIATLSCEQIPENSIMIGHSFGGAIVNRMVGVCPTKIKQLIYVSAVVPLKGEKPFDRLSARDQKEYGKAVVMSKTQITPKSAQAFFRVTDATFKFSKKEAPPLYKESMGLIHEPVEYDEAAYLAIPKSYIFTERDAVVSMETQRGYVERAGITVTAGVQTGHFPMYSNPEALAVELQKLIPKP